MIKAVIFDVAGVLIHSLEANHRFFSDLMKKFGYGFMSKDEYSAKFFHKPMKDMIKHSINSNNEEEIMKIWKSGKDREIPYPEDLLGIPENLEEVIKSLSEEYILGIVTSRTIPTSSITPLKNLINYFKTEVLYMDTQNHKPHPEPLLLASARLGIPVNECVYVGDSESDIVAAKAAGMKGIIYSKKSVSEADANITEFSKLEETIANL